jgi:hypothetical protein
MKIKRFPAGFVVPTQPIKASRPPSDAGWVHEIKHDGHRLVVRRDGPRVRLYSRNAYDLTSRLPAIAAAAERRGDLPTTPRATAARGQLYRNRGVSHFKRLGACPKNGMNAMPGKIIIGLTAVAVAMVVPTMSASGQQTPAQQKKVTVNIPKQVCEIVTVGTQNWGQQTVQVCGPPGGPRGQATAISPKLKYRQAKPQ